MRHDRVAGLRAQEGPGGTRPNLPQTLRTFVRPRDDAILRGVLWPQVDGPRRDSKADGPEAGVPYTERSEATPTDDPAPEAALPTSPPEDAVTHPAGSSAVAANE